MSEPRVQRIRALFEHAVELLPADRATYLAEACPDDPTLCAEVESLLAHADRETSRGFPASPVVRSETTSAPPLPASIGPFRLWRSLGAGGMGTVYEAQQDNPRRSVALKVIRADRATPELVQRFRREAHILARLQHPGIAQVYEAGVDADGRPYFAMEFIRGVPLDEYARGHGLDARARLELLARVCDAVEHAHSRGVIHRDLKPGNILVDDSGQSKVLDFGVARVTDADVRTATCQTEVGELIGTLAYMSPEQMAADPTALDRRADVYSLGVILFQLLSGRLPYALEHLPLSEVVRVIREQTPVRLSALDARLRGDMETIVAKALEKEPARRYSTAAELADDIRRHLRSEPIKARPPSALYQLSKFARRHKALVLTTAAFLALLLGAGAVTAWQAIQLARAERDQAVQQARRSEDVHDALTRAAQLREQARSADGDTSKWTEARVQARRAEALAQTGLPAPELQEQVAALLGELDQEEKDHKMLVDLDGIRIRQAELKGEQFDMRAAVLRYAAAFRRYGIDMEALSVAEAARRVRASQVGEALLTALDHWAYWTRANDQPDTTKLLAVADAADDNSWRRALREAGLRVNRERLKELAVDPRALKEPPPVQAMLGQFLQGIGLPEDAIVFLRRAQQRHPDDFWLNHDLGYALMEKMHPPRPAEALSYFRAALALRPRSAGVHYNIGNALLAQGDAAGAAVCFRRAIELEPNYAAAHSNLGGALNGLNDPAGAAAACRRAIELDPKMAAAHYGLGMALRSQGNLAGAVGGFRRAVELDPNNFLAHVNLGEALQAQGDLAGGAAHFRRAVELDPKDETAHYNLGVALQQLGDPSGAAACYRRVLDFAPNHAEAHCNLGNALVFQGDFRGGLKELQIGHELGSRKKDWHNPSRLWLKQAEQMLELDGRLPAVLKGEARPSGTGERIALATLCRYKKLYAASTRFFTEAFNDDEKLTDFREARRYRAACAAALAGCGEGKDAPRPDETERARLRGQALDWLRADLAAWIKHLEESSPPERAEMRPALTSWQHDLELACVRDASSLARLPAAERDQWNKLWTDVAATLAKVRETK
jgi:tetratricopeptide (TPR) repeat protein/predicted Ser/Thr protein kinase